MLTIIKIGGNTIDDDRQLQHFLRQFSEITTPKILVHGGGKIATAIGEQLHLEPKYIDGRRITDERTLELVTMVYGGLINKNIVAKLQENKCMAIGLTGADGNIIRATKRTGQSIDYGYVGDIGKQGVNRAMIKQLLEAGLVPVVAPLTHDGKGQMLNTNADTIATELAIAMSDLMPVQLIYCFEKKGVLQNLHDEESVIPEILSTQMNELQQQGTISAGMLPKITNACRAAERHVSKVVIGSAEHLNELLNNRSGTIIK